MPYARIRPDSAPPKIKFQLTCHNCEKPFTGRPVEVEGDDNDQTLIFCNHDCRRTHGAEAMTLRPRG